MPVEHPISRSDINIQDRNSEVPSKGPSQLEESVANVFVGVSEKIRGRK